LGSGSGTKSGSAFDGPGSGSGRSERGYNEGKKTGKRQIIRHKKYEEQNNFLKWLIVM
jgi:hypothetical protein